MAKVATRFLEIDPWQIIEKDFNVERGQTAESIYSVGNEFMGVRGFFEEGYSGDTLLGSYFNGIYEYEDIVPKPWPVGPIDRWHYMVNAVNWLYTRISVDGEQLDLAKSKFSNFERRLDLLTGVLVRQFTWQTASGRRIALRFERFTSMTDAHLAGQRISFTADAPCQVQLEMGLDFGIIQASTNRCMWDEVRAEQQDGLLAIMGRLPVSRQRIVSTMRLTGVDGTPVRREKYIGTAATLQLTPGTAQTITRIICNSTQRDKTVSDDTVWQTGLQTAQERTAITFDSARDASIQYWNAAWQESGVAIEGDALSEQGVRFGIFQLHQTYHGVDPSLNVAAKGLTGEEYCGHTWWDTETYCLPFYLFNNPKAARNLLGYRYRTLPNAILRSKADDCVGARYPMSSIDGYEACGWWAHGDLEIHVSGAVAYGVWHYVNVTNDREFLYSEGLEMLLQISRYYASRGGYNQKTGAFGFYGVMGPDEFHMMVNNNCYTNMLGKKTFEWTLAAIKDMQIHAPAQLKKLLAKVGVKPQDLKDWAKMAKKMHIPQDKKTGLYEQHDGYFNYPHTDVSKIPPEDLPLYHHWSYFRIFRTDMIKQPDVLLLHFFFSHEYSPKNKKVNYDYYEERCSHESSLSPGIHSILAAELGYHKPAFEYWAHAARLDLDDYNRNTWKGLHTTSMAAAWLNVVYGFGGMRSDAENLSFDPTLPRQWKSFTFQITYRGSVLAVQVGRKEVTFRVVTGPDLKIDVFGKSVQATTVGIKIPMPKARCA
ncbi:MAG: glycosyl hydrolase family 65 protein [Phycisphaerae bacterium]